jgi:hypothetical protein
MNKLLFADAAGPRVQKLYSQSHYALAGLVPATLVSPSDSIPAKIADLGLAAAIPLHSHVGLNYGEGSVRTMVSALGVWGARGPSAPHATAAALSAPPLTTPPCALPACAVVSDYVPRALQLPARVAVLGVSGVMFLGLVKLSLSGPGIGGEPRCPARTP